MLCAAQSLPLWGRWPSNTRSDEVAAVRSRRNATQNRTLYQPHPALRATLPKGEGINQPQIRGMHKCIPYKHPITYRRGGISQIAIYWPAANIQRAIHESPVCLPLWGRWPSNARSDEVAAVRSRRNATQNRTLYQPHPALRATLRLRRLRLHTLPVP